jgi:transposase
MATASNFAPTFRRTPPCIVVLPATNAVQVIQQFVQLPKRWIVERTFAWLNRCRRLAKNWENLNRNALAFLKLASSRLILRKLCRRS